MKKKRNLLLVILALIPFTAAAVAPFLIVLGVAAVVMLGYSAYRTAVPINIEGATQFFSSCWSCGIFSDILKSLSEFIPTIYAAIGKLIIPIASALLIVWFLWTIISDYIKIKQANDIWKTTGDFGTNLIKLVFISFLLMFPLPRFIMNTFIEPIMNIGLSYNNSIIRHLQPDTSFDVCMVVTALNDKSDSDVQAYSPKIRHNILCQIARFHQITGTGMAIGWTIANMSFSFEYGSIGPLPNVGLLAVGIFVFIGFLFALLPIPLYFLNVFLKLSLDLVMLPLALLNWLFAGWSIFPKSDKARSVGTIVDDAVRNTFGIALVGLFVGLAMMLLDAMIGDLEGFRALTEALKNNDSKFLMEALKLSNNAFLSVIMAAIFIAMIMDSIPSIVNELFKTAQIPIEAELLKSIKTVYGNAKNTAKGWYDAVFPGKK